MTAYHPFRPIAASQCSAWRSQGANSQKLPTALRPQDIHPRHSPMHQGEVRSSNPPSPPTKSFIWNPTYRVVSEGRRARLRGSHLEGPKPGRNPSFHREPEIGLPPKRRPCSLPKVYNRSESAVNAAYIFLVSDDNFRRPRRAAAGPPMHLCTCFRLIHRRSCSEKHRHHMMIPLALSTRDRRIPN